MSRLFNLAATAMALGLAACGGGDSPSVPPGPPPPPDAGVPAGWQLVWSDEFDADGLPDAAKWGYDTERNRAGWYNGELQYYAAARTENSRVEKGSLFITARKETLSSQPDFGGQAWTSARMLTRGKAQWTYGFFEVRAKLPCGMGTWPAIWMLGVGGRWPQDGEIDIMEQRGWSAGTVSGTAHTQSYNGGAGPSGSKKVTDTCDTFHKYQVKWTSDALTWGVDDVTFYTYRKSHNASRSEWPFDDPQYMLLNVAVGGVLGGAPDDTKFPARMEVDYVRVYQAPPQP